MKHITGFVHPDLMHEIDRKRDLLLGGVDSEYHRTLALQLMDAAIGDASYHSVILEADKARNSERVGRTKDRKSMRDNLTESWDLLKVNFDRQITPDLLCLLAQKVEPKSGGVFRDTQVYVKYRDPYIPPSPSKVPHEMQLMLEVTNNPNISFLERALHLHFQFLRIHPLKDGNGRTARFAQNFLLHLGDYPPAFIPVGDRPIYNSLIRSAQEDFRQRGSEHGLSIEEKIHSPPAYGSPESHFYEFLASKVNVILDDLTDRLEALPLYRIELHGGERRGNAHGIKVHLQGYFTRNGSPGQARLVDAKQGVLEVRGQIPYEVMDKIIGKTHTAGYKIISSH